MAILRGFILTILCFASIATFAIGVPMALSLAAGRL